MERVRKFGIWARLELGIGHDVRRAFRTGGIRTWGRNRAVKTNRLVHLFVCLSARISQKLHVHTSQNFLYVLSWTAAWSSSDNSALRYVLPVLWMTSCLPIMRPMARGGANIHVGAVPKRVVKTFTVFARGRLLFVLVVVYTGNKLRTGDEV